MNNQTIPVNPVMLKWARETAGYSVADVVREFKRKQVTIESVTDWEREGSDTSPNYVQLERLAYKIYHRPLAIFFFPEPPEEVTPRKAFRTLSNEYLSRLSPRMLQMLREAQIMQQNVSELNDGVNPAQVKIFSELSFRPTSSVVEMCKKVREILGIRLIDQSIWKSQDEAFKKWRDCLEEHGISIFKAAFKEEGISGFCLHDEEFPVIYVNNSTSATKQTFTLFHELAHLLFHTGGVYPKSEGYLDTLKGEKKKIEVFCNRFAGEFLVPDDDFDKRSSGLEVCEENCETLAQHYHVSREVILRKFLDKGKVFQDSYDAFVLEWNKQLKKPSGGNHYLTQRAYLGEHYLELAFKRYYDNRIDVNQLSEYVGEKISNIPKLENLLFT